MELDVIKKIRIAVYPGHEARIREASDFQSRLDNVTGTLRARPLAIETMLTPVVKVKDRGQVVISKIVALGRIAAQLIRDLSNPVLCWQVHPEVVGPARRWQCKETRPGGLGRGFEDPESLVAAFRLLLIALQRSGERAVPRTHHVHGYAHPLIADPRSHCAGARDDVAAGCGVGGGAQEGGGYPQEYQLAHPEDGGWRSRSARVHHGITTSSCTAKAPRGHRHRLTSTALGTGCSARASDSASIRLRARRPRSARTQSAVASTPRARPAATTTGAPITTIVEASGTLAVARGPMSGRLFMREWVSNCCAKT